MHLRSLLTNKNRVIVCILVCIMALGILAGCGQNQVSDTSENTAAENAAGSWFQHVAQEIPGENARTEWCESIDDEQYGKLV